MMPLKEPIHLCQFDKIFWQTPTTWYIFNAAGDETLIIFLIRRNSEEAVKLAKIDMPDDIKDLFMEENGNLKGVFGYQK